MLTLTVALDSGLVYVGGLRRNDDQEVLLRNGDVIPTVIEFRNSITNGNTVDMGSNIGLRLTVKPKGKYDDNTLLSVTNWVRTATESVIDYRATVNTASGGIDRILGVDPYTAAESIAIQPAENTTPRTYFDLADEAGPVRVWMGIDGPIPTEPPTIPTNGRLIKVSILGTENALAIAPKIAAALEADLSFIATASGSLVTVTSATIGQRIPPHPRRSGYGITVLEAGADETVVDLPSAILQAEIAWTYNGNLTTTRALRWKVENTNRRASQPASLPYFDTANIAGSVILFTPQALTGPQQTQARTNIGAGPSISGTLANAKVVGVVSDQVAFSTFSDLGAAVDGGQV